MVFGCPSAEYTRTPSESWAADSDRISFELWAARFGDWKGHSHGRGHLGSRCGSRHVNSPLTSLTLDNGSSTHIFPSACGNRRYVQRVLSPRVYPVISDTAQVTDSDRFGSSPLTGTHAPRQNHFSYDVCDDCGKKLPDFMNMVFMDGHLQGVESPARQHNAHSLNAEAGVSTTGDYHWECLVLDGYDISSRGGSRVAGEQIRHGDGSCLDRF